MNGRNRLKPTVKIAPVPNKVTQKLKPIVAVCIGMDEASRKTTPKLFAGTAKPLTKVTQTGRTVSPICIPMGKESRRITPKLFAGTAKPLTSGNAKAENGIALLYSQGQGVPQDYAEALRWYHKATDQGYAPAQFNLGNMYYYGRGVPKDRVEAGKWYQKAADQGDEYAQRALGLKGRGLSIIAIVTLTGLFLWCWRALKESISPQRERQSRALTTAGLCGLAYVGLSLYGAFGSFPSVLSLNAFHFAESSAAGIAIALVIPVFGPKRAKLVLAMSSSLLLVNDLIVVWRHELTRFVTTVRGFSSINGLLIGMTVTLGIFLWLETMKRTRGEKAAW